MDTKYYKLFSFLLSLRAVRVKEIAKIEEEIKAIDRELELAEELYLAEGDEKSGILHAL